MTSPMKQSAYDPPPAFTLENAREHAGQYARMFGDISQHWNTHAFLRDNMRAYTVKPGWLRMQEKECFTNSAMQSAANKIDFVDGFVSACGILIRHAWNIEDGKAVDFTLPDPAEREYYGVPFPAKVANKIVRSKWWQYSEGLIGTLQRMGPEKRNKLLKEAGYDPG